MFYSEELTLLKVRQITSKKGDKFKLMTLVDTTNYNKLQLIGSHSVQAEMFEGMKVKVRFTLVEKENGFSVFVHDMEPAE